MPKRRSNCWWITARRASWIRAAAVRIAGWGQATDPLKKAGRDVLRPAGTFTDLKHLKGVSGTNVAVEAPTRHGDVEKGFAQSDRIFEHTFRIGKVVHASRSRTGHAFLNFDPDFKNTTTIFISRQNVKNFPQPPECEPERCQDQT